MTKREELFEFLNNCVKVSERPFVLASGKTSNVYIDCRQILLNPRASILIGELIYQMTIIDRKQYYIGGLETASIPITLATCLTYYDNGHDFGGFWVKKQLKDHGTGSLIEGTLPYDYPDVLLVDDVGTTGGSLDYCINTIKDQRRAKVTRIVTLIDRNEGCRERFGEVYSSLFDLTDFWRPR